jgi:hypothetical protein
MLNKDIVMASIGMKKMQTMNENIRNQLEHENMTNRTKKMRVEDLKQCVIDLGENPQDGASVKSLIKTKDTKIQVLKKKY